MGDCAEPATHRALVGGQPFLVCEMHAYAGDIRLDQLPALYP